MSSDHHFPCPCGAELADECPSCAQSNPFGSMRIVNAYAPPTVEDLSREDDEDDYDLR